MSADHIIGVIWILSATALICVHLRNLRLKSERMDGVESGLPVLVPVAVACMLGMLV